MPDQAYDKSKQGFAGRLREELERSGYSQARISKLVGVSKNSVNAWARGRSVPDAVRLASLSQALGMDANVLLGLKTEAEAARERERTLRELLDELGPSLDTVARITPELRLALDRSRSSEAQAP